MNYIIKDMVVKVYFKEGISVEGVVFEWNDNLAILRALNGNNKLLIYRPTDNAFMVKILDDSCKHKESGGDIDLNESSPPHVVSLDAATNMPESDFSRSENTMLARTRRLVELRISKGRDERAQVAQALQRAPKESSQGAKYEFPDFTKRRSFNNSA